MVKCRNQRPNFWEFARRADLQIVEYEKAVAGADSHPSGWWHCVERAI